MEMPDTELDRWPIAPSPELSEVISTGRSSPGAALPVGSGPPIRARAT